jgi:hypothetical protein
MVIQGEGRGKIPSPHSVNILGNEILSKLGGMIHNGSLYNFSYILVLFRWKNWRNSLARPILGVGPSLVIWGIEPSRANMIHQVALFGVKNL